MPSLKKARRYVVVYETEDKTIVKRFSVWAETAALATAYVIDYIQEHRIHKSDDPYYLIPRISPKGICDYEIY